MAFINQATSLNVKSELDIFTTSPVQTSVESGSHQSYRPVTSLSNHGPIEFVVSGSSNDEYLDLARVYLHVKARLTVPVPAAAANAVAGAPAPPVPVVGPTNNWLHSMFSQVDVDLNQKCISTPCNAYGYKSYIECLLNYSGESKKSHLTTALWETDTAGHMDSIAAANVGFTTRRTHTVNNQTVDLYGPLHCDLFNVDKYMLSGVEMCVKLQRARPEFHLMGEAAAGYTFEITDAELFVRKVKINPSILLAHHKALTQSSAKFPLRRVEIKTFTIPAQTQSKTLDNIFLGTMPSRCIIGFVNTTAFNGNLTLNPYSFQPFDYRQLCVYVDSIAMPTKPFECDFPNNQYIRAYHSLFEGSNINYQDIGNDISRSDYPNGYALVAVDLTPDLSSSSPHISLPKTGSLRLDVHFGAALANSITAVIYAEFSNLLEVTSNRTIITDYSS